jgi:hypothetical protein
MRSGESACRHAAHPTSFRLAAGGLFTFEGVERFRLASGEESLFTFEGIERFRLAPGGELIKPRGTSG